MLINVTLFTDPACPWGYSAHPQFRVLEWRYGSQLDWRLVLIGLREEIPDDMRARFDGARVVEGLNVFRQRYGMPFSLQPKPRPAASGRACRLVVAARLAEPGSEWRVLRALQFANFTMPVLLDEDEHLRDALRRFGLEEALVDAIDDSAVEEAYQRDRAEARSAAGTPIALQGKGKTEVGGSVRFTAPSIVFELDGRRLDAGGWQPSLTYDTCVANLDPTLDRTPPPETPAPLLERFAGGLTTAEVAMLMAGGADEVADREGALAALEQLAAAGAATRDRLGSDAVWRSASVVRTHAGELADVV